MTTIVDTHVHVVARDRELGDRRMWGGCHRDSLERSEDAAPPLKMQAYITGVLIAGVVVPILLHLSSPALMPWWPDTASMGIAFGAAAVAIVCGWESN